jgi:anaerobic selenocysteine-containing dehydrogenase
MAGSAATTGDTSQQRTVRTFCRICMASCGIDVTVDGDHVVGVRPHADHAVSEGYTCPKGRAIGDVHDDPRRLNQPLIRINGRLEPTDWETCLDDLGTRLNSIVAEHGSGSIGVFHGGGMYIDAAGHWATRRLTNALGTHNIFSDSTVDSAAKWRVGELMAGTTSLLPHPDEKTKLLLLIGTNPVVSHGQTTAYPNPVERLRRAKQHGQVWVIDPRRTESARLADRYVAIRPGGDYALLAYLVRETLAHDVDIDELAMRADGIEVLRASVAPFTAQHASDISGVSVAELEELQAAVRTAGKLAIMTGTGTTMSAAGNLTEWMAWSLLIITGSFDNPGGMWFNPGYLARLDERPNLPRAYTGPGAPSRPDIGSVLGEWPAALIADEIEAGRVKAFFILGSNLLTTVPDSARLQRALESLEVLVCFDVIVNQTAELATHVLACKGQLERPDVPFLNDIFAGSVYTQYTPTVFGQIGERRAMWWTLNEIGKRLGHNILPSSVDADTATDDDMLQCVAQRHSLDALKAANGPLVHTGSVWGWAESKLPDGVWHLGPQPLVKQLNDMGDLPPLALIPRRQNRKMNAREFGDHDQPDLLINPADADPLSITDGDTVAITSTTGTIEARAKVTDAIRIGAVSLPHGWRGTNVNKLIDARDLDSLTGMPLLSGTAVSVRPVATAAATVA